MDYTNLKLLSLYYSLQKNLLDGLAAPMLSAVKPVIAVKQNEFAMITAKVLPFLKGGIDSVKLESFITKTFTGIDSGEVAPERYLGHRLNPAEIVAQLEMHDTFMKFNQVFFTQISDQQPSLLLGIQEDVGKEISQMKLDRDEIKMLMVVFSKNKDSARSPITLNIDTLRDVVDSMYEATCNQSGPAFADKLLSYSIKEAGKASSKFNADTFL